MKLLLKKVRWFLASEDGPTAVEYAVMLSLIVVVCLTAITSIGTKASSVFLKPANSIHDCIVATRRLSADLRRLRRPAVQWP